MVPGGLRWGRHQNVVIFEYEHQRIFVLVVVQQHKDVTRKMTTNNGMTSSASITLPISAWAKIHQIANRYHTQNASRAILIAIKKFPI